MSHTPTPWAVWNAPITNPKFHRKLGPLIVSSGRDEDILFAGKAVNSHDRLVEALRWVRANYASGSTKEINDRIAAALEGL